MGIDLHCAIEARSPQGWIPLYDTRWEDTFWWDDACQRFPLTMAQTNLHHQTLLDGLHHAMPLLIGIARVHRFGNPWKRRGVGGKRGVALGLDQQVSWPDDVSTMFSGDHHARMGWILWGDLQRHRQAILHSRPRTLLERLLDRWLDADLERLSTTASGLHTVDDALQDLVPLLLGVGCTAPPSHGLAMVDAGWWEADGPCPTAHQEMGGRRLRQGVDGVAPDPRGIRLLFHVT